jgi:hypothetical protein
VPPVSGDVSRLPPLKSALNCGSLPRVTFELSPGGRIWSVRRPHALQSCWQSPFPASQALQPTASIRVFKSIARGFQMLAVLESAPSAATCSKSRQVTEIQLVNFTQLASDQIIQALPMKASSDQASDGLPSQAASYFRIYDLLQPCLQYQVELLLC